MKASLTSLKNDQLSQIYILISYRMAKFSLSLQTCMLNTKYLIRTLASTSSSNYLLPLYQQPLLLIYLFQLFITWVKNSWLEIMMPSVLSLYSWSKFQLEAFRQVKLILNDNTFRFPYFDDSVTPFNEIFTLLACLVALQVAAMELSVDSIYVTAIMTLKTHFEILQYQFRTIEFTHSTQDSIYLKSLVKYHQEILVLTDSVNKVFPIIFFTQTICTTFQLCLSIFQILELTESMFEMVTTLAYLSCLFIELAMFCFGGEMITSESFNVGLAIQESSWYNLRSVDRVIILIMLARTQKPVVITSGFFDASLEMFMKVGLGFF